MSLTTSSTPPSLHLQVLCRNLSSIPPTQLPRALPSLTKHIARCGRALSTTAQDQKKPREDEACRAALLVHKLKTVITTLLTGRNPHARFAAVGLVKAVVDVGGWETLRGVEPWVRGLLSIIQRGDPVAAKELAVITLTRIYVLLQPYPTLIREIATPTIPAFATACLQLIKPTASALTASNLETICDAFSTLIPLYPTTFRPFSGQTRSAIRAYLAPTSRHSSSSSSLFVTRSLQRAAGRLAVSLHHVATKSGSGDDWAKRAEGVIRELHATADQVLRSVHEAWPSSDGYVPTKVDLDGEPSGGSASPDELPPWIGLSAGVERLVGLFLHLADYLTCPTRCSVAVPLSAMMGAISRVCLIAKPSPKSQNWDQALETNPAIGREEKEELWCLIPQVHVAATDLTLVMLQRFEQALLPLIPDALDNLVRIFKSGMDVPEIRQSGYLVLHSILSIAGPTLTKQSTASIEPLVAACCRDLQHDAGLLEPGTQLPTTDSSKKKNNKVIANADLFLRPPASSATTALLDPILDADHRAAANSLLPALFSNLPQQHVKASLRRLVDKTAILTRNRDAMLASVLHPYRDRRGRMYPSILPHLTRLYPQHQGLEVIRTNMRVGSSLATRALSTVDDDEAELEADEGEEADEEEKGEVDVENGSEKIDVEPQDHIKNQAETMPELSITTPHPTTSLDDPSKQDQTTHLPSNPFAPAPKQTTPSSTVHPNPPPKRKHDGSSAANPPKRRSEAASPSSPKRHEDEEAEGFVLSTAAAPTVASAEAAAVAIDNANTTPVPPVEENDDSDDSESVHLNMELDEDDAEDEMDG
ncbi:hypothetical protein L249_6612 [Ophiocordyceps polyrhachis-furcata BCC 54312]|uniref:Pre-rRNA-processing protein RIX1 n=1 Tax=Ophiocordyceps polyrhachis-furcata BCC 54312 TaxID=1330021 RepID=A0A367LLU5_9HYPO|nr:hypothetical protein L249_6612 [Ophiocordyceps polyrhachis-furcata BCC 54312]